MISKKTINAVELCVLLAEQRDSGYFATSELSSRLGLSISYLEIILKALKDHNIVTSMKGPGGGYKILGDVSLVSVADIAFVFEQTLGDIGQESHACPSYERELEQVIRDMLSSFSLSDFVDPTRSEHASLGQEIGRFKFKPLAATFIPKAPNSVFQLHMSL
jgi:Rrf2 family protein